MIKISPSILACDFTKLGEEIESIRLGGAEMAHLDVMDGIFVTNISFGLPVIESIRKSTSMFLDVHLMITKPERYIERFIDAGADLIVGTHAHQLQGVEFYKGKAIFYNLGNFWFNAKDIPTGLMTLELDSSGREEFYFIPGLQSGCKTKYLLGTEKGREILDTLESYEPNRITISDDGKITFPEE